MEFQSRERFIEIDEEGTDAAVAIDENAPADRVERLSLFSARARPIETQLFWGRLVDGETLQE